MINNSNSTKRSTDSRSKKDDKNDVADSTKNKSNTMLPLKLDDLKKDNKDKEHLSYYEKQVLKELKGIRKASKNILKTLRKINS